MSQREQSPSIFIAESALATVVQHAVVSADGLETGGILLGLDRGESIDIRHAGDPGPLARRAQRSFLRDLTHAQQLAQRTWNLDRSQWIGDWHTHLSAPPVPSERDLDSYQRHLHDSDLGLDRFVALIVGLDPDGTLTIATWLIDRHNARTKRLRRTND